MGVCCVYAAQWLCRRGVYVGGEEIVGSYLEESEGEEDGPSRKPDVGRRSASLSIKSAVASP